MPRVSVYENQVDRQGITGARIQSQNFGRSGIADGLEMAGRAISETADRIDQIEDVKARIQANELAVEHSELTRQIGNRVRQTLGDQAEGAAELGMEDLDKGTEAIIARANPRAQQILRTELAGKNVIARDGFLDHGFQEKVKAFETSSTARIASTIEDAADEPDEQKAMLLMQPIQQLNEQRAQFFGHDREWVVAQNRAQVSDFFKSRALKLAVGPQGSASAALEYAEINRSRLTDADYNTILAAYSDNALDEIAASIVYGGNPAGAATVSTGQTAAVDDLAPLPEGQAEPTRALDPVAFFKSFVSPWEGGAQVVVDSNGAKAKYGVNAAHNPGTNVESLTEDQAAAIFNNKYFKASGADKLPPGLAAIHADTYWLNQTQAAKILKESGGDPDKYIEMRHAFLDGLAEQNPAKYGKYKEGWRNRTNALAEFAARQGTNGAPLNITATTSMEGVTEAIMARKDIGLALKTKMIAAVERKRNDIRQERALVEEEAHRSLLTKALELGDGFTNLKQLPQDALLNASPSTIATFTNMAKQNTESKPLSPDLATYINFTEVSDPHKFASSEFLTEITAKGAPLATIRTVAARQGEIAGQLASAKPDPVASGTLWTVAKPAFESAGLFFDTIETKGGGGVGGKKKEEERISDERRKGQALTFLREMAQHWAVANPGKQPDEATVRGWVGYALRQARPDKKVYELSDQELYLTISVPDLAALRSEFRKQGIEPTVALVTKAYRRARSLNTGPR